MVILDGVALDRFAVPPLLEKAKSPAASAVPADRGAVLAAGQITTCFI